MKNGGKFLVRSLVAVALCSLGMTGGCSSEVDVNAGVQEPVPCQDCKVPETLAPTFVSSWSLFDTAGVGQLGLADFNGDGFVDIAFSGSLRFGLLLGDGKGSFKLSSSFSNALLTSPPGCLGSRTSTSTASRTSSRPACGSGMAPEVS